MCEFISWIEKEGGIFYLTYDEIYHTAKGKELQKYCGSADDYIGHGAIRYFFDIKGGTDKECVAFTSPDNFPQQISRDIKLGKIAGLGFSKELLTQTAWAKYREIEQAALAQYKEIEQTAWAKYREIEQADWAQYNEIKQIALAKYKEMTQVAFWEIFTEAENRSKNWR